MMREQFIPPTAGFKKIDDQIGVAPASAHTRHMRHILKNAFGFGGNNAAVIISAVEGTS
jgi:3-oxoacyl-(acyl-carrier-protein) synthase